MVVKSKEEIEVFVKSKIETLEKKTSDYRSIMRQVNRQLKSTILNDEGRKQLEEKKENLQARSLEISQELVMFKSINVMFLIDFKAAFKVK